MLLLHYSLSLENGLTQISAIEKKSFTFSRNLNHRTWIRGNWHPRFYFILSLNLIWVWRGLDLKTYYNIFCWYSIAQYNAKILITSEILYSYCPHTAASRLILMSKRREIKRTYHAISSDFKKKQKKKTIDCRITIVYTVRLRSRILYNIIYSTERIESYYKCKSLTKTSPMTVVDGSSITLFCLLHHTPIVLGLFGIWSHYVSYYIFIDL